MVFAKLQLTLFVPAVVTLVYQLHRLRKQEDEKNKNKPRVVGIVIYPIKSCHGINLKTGKITQLGFEHDRAWMVVDERNRFVTQRQMPKMATIVPSFKGEHLCVDAPGMETLKLPLTTTSSATKTVSVWSDSVLAIDEGAIASEWFSRYLAKEVQLVRTDLKEKRIADPKYWTEHIPGPKVVSFTDGFPFLLTTQESLDYLNANLPTAIPMTRFRPNIVVQGAQAPFDEDNWKSFRIRNVAFHAIKPCGRCRITTTDQETGVVTGAEPLATLQRLRKVGDDAMFGQNVSHEHGGVICVGDVVDILPSSSQ